MNTYGYVGGNPLSYDDPYGLWASQHGAYVHQNAIRSSVNRGANRVERRRNQRYIDILIDATVYADSEQFQNAESSYRHAMRSPTQSVEEAMQQANQFIRDQFRKAMQLKECGKEDEALFEFGIALHLLQDFTSPAHNGFQVWSGNETAGEIAGHVSQEMVYPGHGSNLDRVTTDAINWYRNGTLPSGNLFSGYGSD